MDINTIEKGKVLAAISYLSIIGLIVTYLANGRLKNEFTKFHLGQAIRVFFVAIFLFIILGFIIKLTGLGFLFYLNLAPFVLSILGILNAIDGKTTPLPIIGTFGEKK